jgi:hypothetical protein
MTLQNRPLPVSDVIAVVEEILIRSLKYQQKQRSVKWRSGDSSDSDTSAFAIRSFQLVDILLKLPSLPPLPPPPPPESPSAEFSFDIFWKVSKLILLFCAMSPSAIGAKTWEKYPTARSLIVAVITREWDRTPHQTVTPPYPLNFRPTVDLLPLPPLLLKSLCDLESKLGLCELLGGSRDPDFLLWTIAETSRSVPSPRGPSHTLPSSPLAWLFPLLSLHSDSLHTLPPTALCAILCSLIASVSSQSLSSLFLSSLENFSFSVDPKTILIQLGALLCADDTTIAIRTSIDVMTFFFNALSKYDRSTQDQTDDDMSHQLPLRTFSGSEHVSSEMFIEWQGGRESAHTAFRLLLEFLFSSDFPLPTPPPPSPSYLFGMNRIPQFAIVKPIIREGIRRVLNVEMSESVVSQYIQYYYAMFHGVTPCADRAVTYILGDVLFSRPRTLQAGLRCLECFETYAKIMISAFSGSESKFFDPTTVIKANDRLQEVKASEKHLGFEKVMESVTTGDDMYHVFLIQTLVRVISFSLPQSVDKGQSLGNLLHFFSFLSFLLLCDRGSR